MSAWTEGRPTQPGIYWVTWEDGGGYPSVSLCVVQMRPAPTAPEFPKFSASGGNLADYRRIVDEWERDHLRLMYCAAEADGKWNPVSEMGWRATHCQPVPRPAPHGADVGAEFCPKSGALPWCDGAIPSSARWLVADEDVCQFWTIAQEIHPRLLLTPLPRTFKFLRPRVPWCESTGAGETCFEMDETCGCGDAT